MPHTVFVAVQSHDRMVEVDPPENASIEIVHATVKAAGIEIDEEFIWTCNGFVPVTHLIMPPWLRTRAG
jgi:hypothetical protein